MNVDQNRFTWFKKELLPKMKLTNYNKLDSLQFKVIPGIESQINWEQKTWHPKNLTRGSLSNCCNVNAESSKTICRPHLSGVWGGVGERIA